jgi:hypothetical protein
MNKTKPENLFWPVFCILAFSFSPTIASSDQTVQTNLAVTARHASRLNGGTVQGSLQQLTGESVIVHSSFAMTGDLLVPGTPTLVLRGKATCSGTIAGDGSTSPSGYKVTISGKCSLRYLRTRTTPVSLPAIPLPPKPQPAPVHAEVKRRRTV